MTAPAPNAAREAALIDAAMTVQLWQRQFPQWMQLRVVNNLGNTLHCYPSWDAIEAEIVRRHLADAEPLRLAA